MTAASQQVHVLDDHDAIYEHGRGVVILPFGIDLFALVTARPCPETVRTTKTLWRLRRQMLRAATQA